MDKQIQGREFYVPERLFLHNLFQSYGHTTETLFKRLNDNISDKIRTEINIIDYDIKHYGYPYGNNLIPNSFKSFVTDMMKRKESDNKIPDYCLLSYYHQIKGLEDSINQKFRNPISEKESKLPICVENIRDDDMEILKKFEECFLYHHETLDAGAASEKQFNRILNLKGKTYNKKETLLVEYLIKNVIPNLKNSVDKDFITSIKSITYNELLYFDVETSERMLYIKGDTQSKVEIDMFFYEKFTELYNMSEDEKDDDKIGNLLLEIFQKLVKIYKSNNISNKPNQEDKQSISADQEDKQSISADQEDKQSISVDQEDKQSISVDQKDIYLYDSIISSHIIRFMKWLPMIPEDFQNIGFMQSVDNVIEKIRCQVLKNLESEHARDRFKHSQDSIFISNNINLRKILIPALHNEFCIHSQFHEYYGFPYYKKEI